MFKESFCVKFFDHVFVFCLSEHPIHQTLCPKNDKERKSCRQFEIMCEYESKMSTENSAVQLPIDSIPSQSIFAKYHEEFEKLEKLRNVEPEFEILEVLECFAHCVVFRHCQQIERNVLMML